MDTILSLINGFISIIAIAFPGTKVEQSTLDTYYWDTVYMADSQYGEEVKAHMSVPSYTIILPNLGEVIMYPQPVEQGIYNLAIQVGNQSLVLPLGNANE